ncbi:MAG: hypothetical protein ACTHJ2_00215 [Candidatus Nitrosocosmicus sp.]
MISVHTTTIISLPLLTILLVTPYYINYIFSEPGIAQNLLHSKLNKNLTNTGCDFLNLCDEHINTKLNGISLSTDNNVIDISFFNSFIDLPFP